MLHEHTGAAAAPTTRLAPSVLVATVTNKELLRRLDEVALLKVLVQAVHRQKALAKIIEPFVERGCVRVLADKLHEVVSRGLNNHHAERHQEAGVNLSLSRFKFKAVVDFPQMVREKVHPRPVRGVGRDALIRHVALAEVECLKALPQAA